MSVTVRQALAGDAAMVEEMLLEAARWVDALGVVMWDEDELMHDETALQNADRRLLIYRRGEIADC